MPSAGLHRLATGELTIQKKKGKALTKAVGKAFAPETILRKNREVSSKNPSAGMQGKK